MQLTDEQKSVIRHLLRFDKNIQTLGGYAGTGKAQPLDSLVLTPSGFVQMGALKVGDEVIVPSGEISRIAGVFPQGVKDIFRVWFSDGHFVECCDDHLWKVIDRRRLSNLKKYKSAAKVFPLSYIRDFITRPDGKNRFYIPTCEPIKFERNADVLIDPYLIGVLIGDGSFSDDNFAIHNEDSEILDKSSSLLSDWNCHLELKSGSDITYNIKSDFGRTRKASSIPLRNELRRLGLWNCVCEEKFIPHVYLHNDLSSRRKLLCGLMDTDGTVDDRTGMVTLTTSSYRLAADVCFLVESLGGLCKIKEQEKTCVYKEEIKRCKSFLLSISLNDTPAVFSLSRKKELAKKRTKYKTQRCIREIEYVGRKPAQCIMVDNDQHLYLTNHFVPTHNTTVIRHIAQALPRFAVCAFTGKAANVLRRKQVEASTIHSLIYKPLIYENGEVEFVLAESLDCEGIIVDEASMVGEDLFNDLCHFNLPIIFVGDHGQLEPVGEDLNLMSEPDFRLETIHRNAGEIAHFAEFIRKGYKPSAWRHQSGAGSKVKFLNKWDYKNAITKVEQVICAYNKTRAEINYYAREALGRPPGPVVGDRVMCLRNNRLQGLFNGMQGVIKGLHGRNGMIFEAEDREYDVFYDPSVFNQVKYEFSRNRDDPNPFDYCWGITCHKAQGDQWWDGLVVEQRCELWDHVRWAYTAASRFINEVWWVPA